MFRLLDLFCGAGGCTAGYQKAGFWVRGVDIKPQPRYCGEEFVRADALEYLAALIESGAIEEFDAIHASPPCQGNLHGLKASNQARNRDIEYVDLIPGTRELCQRAGLPYVIENVEGALLLNAAKLCGSAFDLKVQRHRYFESNLLLFGSACRHSIWREVKYPTNFRPGGRIIKSRVVQVYGNTAGSDLWPEAMGIDWMVRKELSQAIPPAYTEYIGRQMLDAIRRSRERDGGAGGRQKKRSPVSTPAARSIARTPSLPRAAARSRPHPGHVHSMDIDDFRR